MNAHSQRQLTLGALIEALSGLDRARMIAFEFGGCFPTDFACYRGASRTLAIGFSDHGEERSFLVGDLLQKATAMLKKPLTDWNGQTFVPTRDSLLWVSNPGSVSEAAIVDVVERGAVAYIVTAWKG
ncbi:hypothetical protein HCU64_22825 [Methylobacterium sp. C25]|uniref:hypothetical protein n=1 Tax=Methylobacterium sp. C25 TaxID=2721622 RepID=UPI001F231435|nr:hypothetical protein [Methylobacterium sp. C25]MCE4226581.1 hypothetical protein [Methylobacterium sp. C25]